MLPMALTDERVLDRIRPVSRELLKDAGDDLRHLQLRLYRGPEGQEADVRLEIVVVEPEGAKAPAVRPELETAARDLAEAWLAVGQGLPNLAYTCTRDAAGGWETNFTLLD